MVTTVNGTRNRGTVRFHGETKFASGLWYGIELDKPEGRNAGSVQGVRYFSCPEKHGIFATASKIQKVQAEVTTRHQAPTLARRSSLNTPSISAAAHPSTARRSLSTRHRTNDTVARSSNNKPE